MSDTMIAKLLGLSPIAWAPEDEGAGGGGGAEGETTGGDTTGDAGATQTAETVLGGEATAKAEGETEKGDDAKDAKEGDAEGKKDEDGKDASADEVPEDGSYEFELPEGVELDDEKRDFWKGQFKDMGLTRGQASKLIEMQSAQILQDQKDFAKFLETQQNDHLAAAKKDPEIGGDKWDESVRLSQAGLKALGETGAIKQLILMSGNANNPDMIRELARIGRAISDDKFESGASHEAPVSTEKKWYGGTTPETKKG